jgi:DNA-directed RNA polymerase beta' subunit
VGGGSNEDDLTTQLVEILVTNRSLQMLLSHGGRQQSVMEQWGFAQTQVSQFINGELPGKDSTAQHATTGMRKGRRVLMWNGSESMLCLLSVSHSP